MVFATEFDPQDQPQKPEGSQATASSPFASPHQPAPAAEVAPAQRVYATTSDRHTHATTDNVVPLPLEGEAEETAIRVRSASAPVSLPAQPSLPFGLKLLNRINQTSTVITSLLVTGALVLYGSTVYVDKSTNRALAKLDALQGESQQLTTANEAIKQNLAEQATQKNSGLEPYEAGDMLFVEPAPRRDAVVTEESAPVDMPQPLGY